VMLVKKQKPIVYPLVSLLELLHVRVYLVGYLFCIIGCNICHDIFSRLDIMYFKLPYVSGGALLLKTLVFYIY
jgi:hypothetical protein